MGLAHQLHLKGHPLVVPMFIAPGGHVAKDFPMLAQQLASGWPDVEFEWAEVVGGWEEVAWAVGQGIGARLGRAEE